MAERKSFIMYLDLKPTLDKLSYEEKGKLLDAIYEFAETGYVTELENPVTDVVFSVVCQTLRRDSEKYREACEKRAEASRRYWNKKDSMTDKNNRYHMISNDIHSDSDSDTDNVIDSGNDNGNVNDIVSDNDNKNITDINPPAQPRLSEARGCSEEKCENEKQSGIRKVYGKFGNVPMTENEYNALAADYGDAADKYIDKLSECIKLGQSVNPNRAEAVRRWMEKDEVKKLSERAPRDQPMPKGYDLLKKRSLFV